MYNKLFNTTLFVVIIIFVSCSKFLDKKVNSGISTPDNLVTLQALLDNPDIFNTGVSPAFDEASADDYFIQNQDFTSLTERLSGIYI
ncbi:MAG: hypothetical protein J7497_12775, partial [Chitinophagaceae bacterium]|nr:hypothetical protein [Chitinophagaceae bacterium]